MRARGATGAVGYWRLVIVFDSVVDTRQPRREPFHRDLELRVEVDELPHALGEQIDAELLVAPAFLQFLDAAIGEVHGGSGLGASREGLLDDGLLLGIVTVVGADGGRG